MKKGRLKKGFQTAYNLSATLKYSFQKQIYIK